ncbi:tRNA-binding protein [Lujinxingia vulgaris]|uniref:tRNA-binding protein n=1 Tax=Lujinxingia vulgaris TaxID=2600176 RepID=A0A5C6XCI4_9DELT|nr:tRNA-binding protein [Lujinxingia vulgaris]TXD34786.1 tRNA-binding protein [Lujinxingia vulgaris]
MSSENTITWQDFEKVHLRAGTIVRAEPFPEARRPAYKVWVRFGEGDVRKSSAQITERYSPEELVGTRVICVTNFPAKQIGPIRSEVLICGFEDAGGAIVLARPDGEVPDGARLK